MCQKTEMSKQGLRFLNELDTAKKLKRLEKTDYKAAQQIVNMSVVTGVSALNSDLAAALVTYDPSDPF